MVVLRRHRLGAVVVLHRSPGWGRLVLFWNVDRTVGVVRGCAAVGTYYGAYSILGGCLLGAYYGAYSILPASVYVGLNGSGGRGGGTLRYARPSTHGVVG